MLMLLVLLLLVNCVFSEKAEILSEKCKEVFEPHRENIYNCCETPRREFGKCGSICDGQLENKCSCLNCLKEYVPKEKDQFRKMYDRRLNEEFTAEEKDNWLPVLNKSFEHCKPLFDIVNGTDECQFPNNYTQMGNCIWQQNFVNCPRTSFALSENCEATRKFLKEQETCGTKYEDLFVIDDSIWDQFLNRYYKCKETFKEAKLNTKQCVRVPEILLPNNISARCRKQCTTQGTIDPCCIYPCLLNTTSSEDFGQEVVKDKIIEFYKFDCKENGIDFDIWKPVIESSFGICYPLASSVIVIKSCLTRMKYLALRSCMQQELFLNAPTSLIKDPDQFEKIKTFIANETKCGQKYGERFIIDLSFWNL